MAPVDPGSSILWAKNPSYTTDLLNFIVNLPTDQIRQILFSTTRQRSPQWKQEKQNHLDQATRALFTANGDVSREKKQRESVQRRINGLAKEYQDGIGLLKQDPYHVNETLQSLRQTTPYWDTLRALLKNHPEMVTWDEDADQIHPPARVEPMQDINYPHQPVAGPSNSHQPQFDQAGQVPAGPSNGARAVPSGSGSGFAGANGASSASNAGVASTSNQGAASTSGAAAGAMGQGGLIGEDGEPMTRAAYNAEMARLLANINNQRLRGEAEQLRREEMWADIEMLSRGRGGGGGAGRNVGAAATRERRESVESEEAERERDAEDEYEYDEDWDEETRRNRDDERYYYDAVEDDMEDHMYRNRLGDYADRSPSDGEDEEDPEYYDRAARRLEEEERERARARRDPVEEAEALRRRQEEQRAFDRRQREVLAAQEEDRRRRTAGQGIAPGPGPVPQPQLQPQHEPIAPANNVGGNLDDDALTVCPKCSVDLSTMSTADSEAHVRVCLDGGEGGVLESCPVCDLTLSGLDKTTAERHVDDCCKALTGGGGGGTVSSHGLGGIVEKKKKREHVVFECDEKSVPRDDKTNLPLECPVCFEDFAESQNLARLSCYCVYHQSCIVPYWQQPGDKFCPLHRDLDGIAEVEMSR